MEPAIAEALQLDPAVLGTASRWPLDHEVEASKLPVAGAIYGQKQRVVENPVIRIAGLAWKEELGGKDASARTLNLEVEMAGAAGIERRYDRIEPLASLHVGELMTTQAKSVAVVFSVFVRMPDLHEAAGQWPTAIVENEPRNGDPFSTRRTRVEIAIKRRIRFEIGPGFPLQGGAVPIIA